MTKREAWLKAAKEIEGVSQSGRFEAELLLRGALGGESRARFFATLEEELPDDALRQYDIWVAERQIGTPVQYLLGEQEFMGFRFRVTPAVLIPRPDTEILVETVLGFIQGLDRPQIADIATGSGAIGVSLAAICSQAMVFATDISRAALEIAKQNAVAHGVAGRMHFIQGDLAAPLVAQGVKLHCLVSNPPYIPTEDILNLSAEVKNEPLLALDGGLDGLDFYRRLTPQARTLLLPGGLLAVEVGLGQAADVAAILKHQGFERVVLYQDLAGIERVVSGYRRP